jgi:hypothetical protein
LALDTKRALFVAAKTCACIVMKTERRSHIHVQSKLVGETVKRRAGVGRCV